MKQFRTLYVDEIECRVATVKSSGVSLLLYKNARADMNILDETVGAENWQRTHSRGNSNCTVSIWDDGKKQWISKEDTGVESNADADKGKASDSFKRACVNWGIGRELYTAPFVWVPCSKCSIVDSGRKDTYGKAILTCKDKFRVTKIEYDSKRRIMALEIENTSLKAIAFQCGTSKRQSENVAYGDISSRHQTSTLKQNNNVSAPTPIPVRNSQKALERKQDEAVKPYTPDDGVWAMYGC